MKVRTIDHIGIVVQDLTAAKDFFVELGLEVQGETTMEGGLLERTTGLPGARTKLVWLQTADRGVSLELVQYLSPVDEQGIQPSSENTPGIRHIAFEVDDIGAMVEKLKEKGVEFFSEIQNHEDTYKLVHLRGPEGIILELAEKIG